jgi:hypothetical protein
MGSIEDTCKNPHEDGSANAGACFVISPTMPRLARANLSLNLTNAVVG